MKRLTYLLIIIGVVVAVVSVGYFLRYRAGDVEVVGVGTSTQTGGLPPTPTQQTPPTGGNVTPGENGRTTEQNQPTVGTELAGEVKFGIVANNPVANFHVDQENNAVLVQPDGQIVKISQGDPSVLNSSVIKDLAWAEFSYDGKKILASFGKRGDLQHSIFNVEESSWTPLDQKIESASWSPLNYELIYTRKGSGGAKTVAKIDTSQEKPKEQIIVSLYIEDVSVRWTGSEKVVISEKSSVLFPSSAWLLDTRTKAITPLAENKNGMSSVWSGNSNIGLVFSANQNRRGGLLELVDTTGNKMAKLSILTLPQKCVFGLELVSNETSTTEQYLYCSIPKNNRAMEIGQLPDDYQKMAFFTADAIHKINILNGDTEKLPHGQESVFDANNLKIFNGKLFFVNRLDQKLYAMALE